MRPHRAHDSLAGRSGRWAPTPPASTGGTGRITIPVERGPGRHRRGGAGPSTPWHVEVDDIGLRRPTLDEVFLTLTGAPVDADDTDVDPDIRNDTDIRNTDIPAVPTIDEQPAARAA